MWLYFSRTRSISLLVISMSLARPIVCIDGWWSRKRELGQEKRMPLRPPRKIGTAADAGEARSRWSGSALHEAHRVVDREAAVGVAARRVHVDGDELARVLAVEDQELRGHALHQRCSRPASAMMIVRSRSRRRSAGGCGIDFFFSPSGIVLVLAG